MIEKFVLLPWKAGGRSFDGVDCWGLVYLWYKELSIDIPSYDYYAYGRNTASTVRIIAQEKEKNWIEVYEPERNDVILLRVGGLAVHVGIYLGNDKMLHIEEGREACVADLTRSEWKNRILGYYRLQRH